MTQKHYRSGSAFPPLEPGVLRLYSMRYCPYAERTRLVLAHKKIPYETINIHLRDKPEWFLAKTPPAAVPVLEIDDKLVYESTATCEWLDDAYPQYRIQPSDPYIRAWDRILLESFGKITTLFYGLMLKSEEEIPKLFEDLQKPLKYLEENLAKRGGSFFGGKTPSLTDFYFWPHLRRLRVLGTRDETIRIDAKNYPVLGAWFEVMQKVPAVQATADDDKTMLHFLDSIKTGSPDFDYGIL